MLRIKSLPFPIILYHIVFLLIVVANFPVGTYFIGWDSLTPEFNLWLNIKRALFASWQEEYGLGVVTGHGFAATLPHSLIIGMLSLLLPQAALRPTFTFLCLYLGGLGMYFLVQRLLRSIAKNDHNNVVRLDFIALVSSLFYILNLGTAQMFYAQLETFIVHFAALPWLFLIVIRLLSAPSRNNLLLFVAINFLGSVQGFIPSLFISYGIALSLFLATYVWIHPHRFSGLKKAGVVLFLTVMANAYWIFPLMYYQLNYNTIFINSYNNLSSTPHFIDINRKYGDITNIMLLKGYLFDAYELGDNVLKPWILHFQQFPVLVIGYLFFLFAAIGVIFAFWKIKTWEVKALSIVFLFFFGSLGTNMVPFVWLTQIVQTFSPTFEQAFRTTFTKFSIGTSFSYSVFIGIGIYMLLSYFKHMTRLIKNHLVVVSILLVFCCYYAFPTFTGNLFYKRLLLPIPQPYFELMEYFNQQSDGRIADFPQDCPEGWFSYQWGYFGSGFYWYGIKQPFLARTFDVWSNTNENYYWEIQRALQEKDFEKIDAIVQKYQIRWILYDPNLLYCRNQKAFLIHDEFIRYLEQSPRYTLKKVISARGILPIKVFEINTPSTHSFVNLQTLPMNVGLGGFWNDNDTIFKSLGTYITNPQHPYRIFYPFNSLFTKRSLIENKSVSKQNSNLVLTTKLPKGLKSYMLRLDEYIKLESNVGFWIDILPKEPSTYQVLATFKLPTISLDHIPLVSLTTTMDLGSFASSNIEHITLLVNGERIPKDDHGYYKSAIFFTSPGLLEIIDISGKPLFIWNPFTDTQFINLVTSRVSIQLPEYADGLLSVTIPTIADNNLLGYEPNGRLDHIIPQPCLSLRNAQNKFEISNTSSPSFVRLISQNSNECLILPYEYASTSYGYILAITTKNHQGRTLNVSVLNKSRTVVNTIALPNHKEFSTDYLVIPPTFPNEIGYDIKIENISENNVMSISDIEDIRVWQFPYAYLKQFSIESLNSGPRISSQPISPSLLTVSHPLPTTYTIRVKQPVHNIPLLVLSQRFDNGWHAYVLQEKSTVGNFLQEVFPFAFGQEVSQHVLVNNWENGWQFASSPFTNNSYIYISFMPQYSQYLGFLFLLGLILSLLVYRTLSRKST